METRTTTKHALLESWPDFLDLIDTNPQLAMDRFHRYANALLTSNPPPAFWWVSPEDREDCISKTILKCIDNDFAILRARTPGPLSGWVATVAQRVAQDLARSQRATKVTASLDEDREDAANLRDTLPGSGPLQDETLDHARRLEQVGNCIKILSQRCQLLLLAAARGLRPKDMTTLLGWPKSKNKQVGDALSDCRQSLRKCLNKQEKGGEATI